MITVKVQATDGHLTLAELATFVQEAMRVDTPNEARVKVRVAMSGHATSIETDKPRPEK